MRWSCRNRCHELASSGKLNLLRHSSRRLQRTKWQSIVLYNPRIVWFSATGAVASMPASLSARSRARHPSLYPYWNKAEVCIFLLKKGTSTTLRACRSSSVSPSHTSSAFAEVHCYIDYAVSSFVLSPKRCRPFTLIAVFPSIVLLRPRPIAPD